MLKPIKYLTDTQVIEEFVKYLRGNGHPELEISNWPDKENRKTKDIDAIAGNLAIEHTSIDSLPEQRMRDHQFREVIGDLEEELSPRCKNRIRVYLPFEGIKKGQNWLEMRAVLRDWIVDEGIHLPVGHNEIHPVDGFPFDIRVMVSSSQKPALLFWRVIGDEPTFPRRFKTLFMRKAKKLNPYKTRGMTTILLMEMGSIQVDEAQLVKAVKEVFPDGIPGSVSELWYAGTAVQDDIIFLKVNAEA